MNEFIASIILAIVQGLTEWLPVSSSGHLVLFQKLLGVNVDLTFDVALHFGTLMAVFVYFGAEIMDILKDLISGKFKTENGKLGLFIILATIPAALAGYFFKELFEQAFSSLWVVAFGFAITGVFLLIVSFAKVKASKLNGKKALTVGLAQVFSILPGVSRSGTTIGTGILSGLDEKSAIKFSFLMSIPIIFGANVLTVGANKLPQSLIWATLVSFVIALGAIHLLYGKILAMKKNMKWFGAYTLILAVLIILYLVFF
jgi:undecaprenyl-diphosphatase